MSEVKPKYLERSLAKILKLLFSPVSKTPPSKISPGHDLYKTFRLDVLSCCPKNPHWNASPYFQTSCTTNISSLLSCVTSCKHSIQYLFKTVIAQKPVPVTIPLEYQEKSVCVCKFPKNSVLPRSFISILLKTEFKLQYKFWEEDKREIMP